MEIDYDKLLDKWAEKVYAKADKCRELRAYEATGTWTDGYLKGLDEAYIMSISLLTFEERLANRAIKKLMEEQNPMSTVHSPEMPTNAENVQ